MKKPNSKPKSSTETGHNVDIPQRKPRSVEKRQKTPTAPALDPDRPPRRVVEVDASGFQRVTFRRSPRRAEAKDEDRDFEPEVPAMKPKKTKRAGFELLSALAPATPSGSEEPDSQVSGSVSSQEHPAPTDIESPPSRKAPKADKTFKTSKTAKSSGFESSHELLGLKEQPCVKTAPLLNPHAIKNRPAFAFDPFGQACRFEEPRRFLQHLALRETSILGDCLFDAILTSLAMRRRHCDWEYGSRPLPSTPSSLRQTLVRFARSVRDVPLPYGCRLTPAQLVLEDYVHAGQPIIDPAWEDEALEQNPSLSVAPQRHVVSFDDYLVAMSSDTASGDELMMELASIYFGVRIMVVDLVRQHDAADWHLRADYCPPGVNRNRFITLVHVPGHYYWAHPAKDAIADPACGAITGYIKVELDEWLPIWSAGPLKYPPKTHPIVRAHFESGGAQPFTPPTPPGAPELPHRAGCGAHAHEVDGLQLCPVHRTVEAQRAKSLFPESTLAPFREYARELAQRIAADGHEISVEDAAAALYLTRDMHTGEADLERACEVLPGGKHNPIRLSPDQRALGKRAKANEVKRKESEEHDRVVATAMALEPAVQGDAPDEPLSDGEHILLNKNKGQSLRSLSEHAAQPLCHTSAEEASASTVASQQATDDSAAATVREHKSSAFNKWLAEELETKSTAVKTVVALTAASEHVARAVLEHYVPITTNLHDAITAACVALHPAARELTFIERNLGQGVGPLKTATVAKHLAHKQATSNAHLCGESPPSALQPLNLQQRFINDADRELNNHERRGLTAPQRLVVATNRAVHLQQNLAEDVQTWKRDFCTPKNDTAQPKKPNTSAYNHPSPAVRLAAAHEDIAHSYQQSQPAVVVVSGASTKLPLWLPGEEQQQRGFYWSTKQHIQHAWRQYMAAEGMHAPRSFKSLISQQLVPTICAETEIPLTDWEHISDRVLLEKIELRLRPKNSTDVINRLRELSISRDTQKGTLSQRYRVFAETFLQRLAEAQECGCTVSENATKQVFIQAVRQEPALESWTHEEKWTNVWDAHRRIVERLRDYDCWAVYDQMQRRPQIQHTHIQEQRAPLQPADSSIGQKRNWDKTERSHKSFINALSSVLKKASQPSTSEARINYGQGAPQQPSQPSHQHTPQRTPNTRPSYPYQHPGLDDRGPCWHEHTQYITCNNSPCTVPFCQCCGMHGHSAESCTKRLNNTPGINLQGYYQETKPNSYPIRFPGARGTPRLDATFGPPPTSAAPPQRRNAPYSNSTTGDSEQPAQHHYPHFVNSTTGGGQSNNTASRSRSTHPERRVNFSNQTDSAATSNASNSSAHDGSRQ